MIVAVAAQGPAKSSGDSEQGEWVVEAVAGPAWLHTIHATGLGCVAVGGDAGAFG